VVPRAPSQAVHGFAPGAEREMAAIAAAPVGKTTERYAPKSVLARRRTTFKPSAHAQRRLDRDHPDRDLRVVGSVRAVGRARALAGGAVRSVHARITCRT
jgi:hypothetical protein